MFCFFFIFSAGVTIGFQQSEITMNENDGAAHICAVIKCGCVTRDIEVNFFTQDSIATGMLWNATYPWLVVRLTSAFTV